MFVSEASLFSSSTMKIRICSMEGVDIMLDVAPDMTVDKLKVLAVSHLHDPTESAKTSLYHKLVQVSTSKVLDEERSLTQESVRENGKKPEVKHKMEIYCLLQWRIQDFPEVGAPTPKLLFSQCFPKTA